MVCLYCGSPTTVINSRSQRQRNAVWRRRQCASCSAIFTTHEQIDLSASLLIRTPTTKKLQPFSRDRLFVSILESCGHRTRAFEEAAALTETIIAKLLKRQPNQGAVEREHLVAIAHEALHRFDPVAATLYGAYHPSKSKHPKKTKSRA